MDPPQVIHPGAPHPQAAPPQIVIVTHANKPKSPERYTVMAAYKATRSLRVGSAVLTLGALCLAFSISSKVVQSKRYFYIGNDRYAYNNWPIEFCTGVYSGGLYIIAGGLGIGAGRHKTLTMIRGLMAMATMATMAAVSDLIFMITAVFNSVHYDYYPFEVLEKQDELYRRSTTGMAVMQVLVSASALGLCITLCDLAGRIYCCQPIKQSSTAGVSFVATGQEQQVTDSTQAMAGGPQAVAMYTPQPEADFNGSPITIQTAAYGAEKVSL